MRSCGSVDPRHTFRPKVDLTFRVSGQSVEIFEIRPVWRGPPDDKHELPIAKPTFVRARGVWRIFWQRRDLKWHRYEPRPEVNFVEEFASLVSDDALACFYGRLQVIRECGHHIGRHRACPSDSQEAVLAQARSISESRVAKTNLGSSARVVVYRGVNLKCPVPGPDSFRDPNSERP
jgi:Protein of unknown function (DUF3024)